MAQKPDRTEPVVTTTMFTPAEQAAWEVAVQRGLPITAADLRAMLAAAGPGAWRPCPECEGTRYSDHVQCQKCDGTGTKID